MAGVNRAAVAVTDTFDVWRVRTNELNTSLNAGTHAKTADTIVWRDDNASLVANVVTANTLTMTHGVSDATIAVTSALAADATKASIQTTGGIKAALASKFGAAVDVTGALTVGGNTTLGNAAGTDTVTFTLATAQDNGAGLTGSGSLIEVSFTLLSSATGFFDLEFSDASRFIVSESPTATVSFSSTTNASIVIL